MTHHADDPDAHVVYPVTARTGDLSFTPVVSVEGTDIEISAEWLGVPGAVRELKVPLFGLPANYMLFLRLVVPGENDLDLGYVILE